MSGHSTGVFQLPTNRGSLSGYNDSFRLCLENEADKLRCAVERRRRAY